jgi:Flp pilus assembly secretin CpaC
VLNKQKAELIIGKRLGYKTQTFNNQQTIENVQFLDVGTKLILRPFAAPDGFVRMEIHPEQSSGSIDINGLPTVETTEVTSNVMVRDGSTVVIGGLIDEQTEEVVDQIPLLGSIPIVGNAFKTTDERLIRSELIVLITPRIVCDPIEETRGEVIKAESEARAAYFTDTLSSVSRRNLARMHTQRAAELYDQGRLSEARDHTRKALAIRTNDGDALRLQGRIEDSLQERRRGIFSWPPTFERSPTPAGMLAPDAGHATIEPTLVPPAPAPEGSYSP